MTTEIDSEGNTIRTIGIVTEIIIPGPALQASIDARSNESGVTQTKLAANTTALNAFALKARNLARGSLPMPSTVAGRDALLKELCEAFARQWFDGKYEGP